uniref:translocation protein SEC62-like isoform X1 n=1 Tax=Ciona intestinalis TaxID=7719 RepID=UPI000180C2F8|nr:translocation protein SEC62-like isoform X1 [Ciona intestinalis]|eukprot:XP_002125213.1 translocation protein SEC62-like isoform X1 [Ciona intestinalis]
MASLFGLPIVPEVRKDENKPDVDDECSKSTGNFQAQSEEPSKEELQMAKHVRFKTPKKNTIMQKQKVDYFVGSKAVDTLMNSKWAKSSKKGDAIISSREEAIIFMEKLLCSNLFYRVEKILKETKADKEKKNLKSKENEEDSKVKKRKKDKKVEENEKKETDEKKKKRKYKLQAHEEQVFYDSSDIYVWLYDPISPKTWFLGGVLLLGVIAATLFPIWPPSVRVGVYYLTVVGGFFVGGILGTALLRTILFGVIYVFTLGTHHLWVLPNLLEDVGFYDSFKPLYTYEYKGSKQETKESNEDEEEEKEDQDEKDDKEEPKDDPIKSEEEEKIARSTDEFSDESEPELEVQYEDSDYEIIDGKVPAKEE